VSGFEPFVGGRSPGHNVTISLPFGGGYGAVFYFSGPPPTGLLTISINGSVMVTVGVGNPAEVLGHEVRVSGYAWDYPPGQYVVIAHYNGDNHYGAATSGSIMVTVTA
jgi:hypothetical protein